MDTSNLGRIDADVKRAAARLARWRGAPDGEHPLSALRHVAGARMLEALTNRSTSAHDSMLRDGLCRWVSALTQARITADTEARIFAEQRTPRAALKTDQKTLVSWTAAWRLVLSGARAADRDAGFDAVLATGPHVAPLERERREMRREVAARMNRQADEKACASLAHACRVLLAATDDVWAAQLREARRHEDHAAERPALTSLGLGLARSAREGWPAQLTARWVDERVGQFAKGVRMQLAIPASPPCGGASFARALFSFGESLRRAAAPRALPFAIACDPDFVDAYRSGYLFAFTLCSHVFHMRALGVSQRVAHDQCRLFGVAALFDARLAAARVLLSGDVDVAQPSDFEELSVRLLGEPLPIGMFGAWPAIRDAEIARGRALFSLVPLVRALVEQFDVDWFANPRAVEYLSSRACAPAYEPFLEFDGQAQASSLARALEAMASGCADMTTIV